MSKLAFVNAKVYTPKFLDATVVLTNGNKIENLVSLEDYRTKYQPTGEYKEVDCQGNLLSPGWIDLQVNGCGGVNFSETIEQLSEECLLTMLDCCIKHGTTTYLPTLITNPIPLREHALKMYKGLVEKRPEIKYCIPGLHLEGPHLSMAKKGTHNPKFVQPMTVEERDLYLEYKDQIAMLTLAPEENDIELVKPLIDAGILISMGHTNATYEQAKVYIDAGVKTATHLYNAMSPTSGGRAPGIIGAIYTSESVCPGIITDGIHVCWPLVNLSLEVKKDNIFIVTDCTAPAGTDMKEFWFANKLIQVRDGSCYDENGGLSGSAITLDIGMRRLKHNTKLTTEEIIRLATHNPARQINALDSIGQLKPGCVANLTIFDDEYYVQQTYVNGKLEYSKA